jgi:putative peptidoglycan lipid II flippase
MAANPTAKPPVPSRQNPLRFFRPSHKHTAFTATLLLMLSAFLSRIIGLVRVKYIAYLFGAGPRTDAFNSAFQLPDMIAYFLVGGAASVTFVTILSRYRDAGRQDEGNRAMSVILTSMLLVLGTAILLAEFFAPLYVRWWFQGFSPEQVALCTAMTRILLPGQLLFFAGGVFGSVLLVRKQFALQAVTPLIYNLGIIAGGVFLAHILGIQSLAWGALAGVFIGPFLMNAIGAHRAGAHFRLAIDWQNEGLRDWARLSIPLMLGVSLVSFDSWIMNYFASANHGAITLLTYAKSLFAAPVALGQAAGAASLPFLASLANRTHPVESPNEAARPDLTAFARNVNLSVSRILAFSLLLSAWMIALANPAVDLIFRGGQFHRNAAAEMAVYFAIFSISLPLWSAQTLYARAFYAAGNTLAPMVAGTIVVVASLPIYYAFYQTHSAIGLAIASDIGITIQTIALAVMLDRRRMVNLSGLEHREIGKSALAAIVSYIALHLLRRAMPTTGRWQDLALLAAATLIWIAMATIVLKLTGSQLPDQLWSRFRRKSEPLAARK